MKRFSLLAALLLMVASLQTADAQGFRVYQSDGTELQFSLKTDSIVFDNGLSGDEVFGPFTPVNLCIARTWYKSKSETVTFGADGTTDYIAGGTYEFMPYQGNVIIYNASAAPTNILKVYKVTAEKMIVGSPDGSSISVWSSTKPSQLVTSIVLSETNITLQPDESKRLTATVFPADADNPAVTWSSSNDAVAEVNSSGRVTANANGTCTITCSATDGSGVKAECLVTVPNVTEINGHEYVEIGGLKWATMNVGATTVAGSYETCIGDYFAWGEPEPRYMTITRSGAGSATFTWRNGYSSGYSSDNYPTYTGTTLDAAHDAATANWGGSWRMPKREEFMALAKACSGSDSNEQMPVNLKSSITKGGIYWLNRLQTIESAYTGVAGLLFVSMADISKRVFFPACGYVCGTSSNDGGMYGSYWSSSLCASYTDAAYYLSFGSSEVIPSKDFYRFYGRTVRPVSD